MPPIELPTLPPAVDAPLSPEEIVLLHDEVHDLAEKRNAVILAHNYQVPEVQEVADYVGDSLGLSQQAARTVSPSAISIRGCVRTRAASAAAMALPVSAPPTCAIRRSE